MHIEQKKQNKLDPDLADKIKNEIDYLDEMIKGISLEIEKLRWAIEK